MQDVELNAEIDCRSKIESEIESAWNSEAWWKFFAVRTRLVNPDPGPVKYRWCCWWLKCIVSRIYIYETPHISTNVQYFQSLIIPLDSPRQGESNDLFIDEFE